MNVRLLFGVRCIGIGTHTLCSAMDLPPPPRFQCNNRKTLDGLCHVGKMSMRSFAEGTVGMNDGHRHFHAAFDGSGRQEATLH